MASIVNNGVRQELFEEIIRDFNNSSFSQLMGFKLIELGNGISAIEFRPSKVLLNIMGILHGGVSAALCDTAMGISIKTLGKTSVTVEMKINYLIPVNLGEKVKAYGKVIKVGENICVAESEIINANNKIAAKAVGTYFILKSK
ncbi:acyl-CoA thioesterase [Caldanaerovirga acetigignens]|uniref:Acyl-CoA thioesterase n=1 Tax=Caldanaerovirga acetigignens TaxID=447595 RepID=A0A1M7HHC4_9FIRM|nr:PaaI family thioesterase [Caldanaerovirga acetigignens]SHM27723.1 acyl-CoA thioesterase [Caldanaerovirga acetigignens]